MNTRKEHSQQTVNARKETKNNDSFFVENFKLRIFKKKSMHLKYSNFQNYDWQPFDRTYLITENWFRTYFFIPLEKYENSNFREKKCAINSQKFTLTQLFVTFTRLLFDIGVNLKSELRKG